MDSKRWLDRALSGAPWWARYPIRVAWHAALRWFDASGMQLGATIAFYTTFSLAPWLVIAIAVAGMVFGADAARGQMVGQIEGLVGPQAAKAIESMIASAWRAPGGSTWAAVLGVVTLLIGASGVFVELRRAINAVAGIDPDAPTQGSAVGAFVRVRLTAFALLLGFGFLAAASMLLSAGVSALADFAEEVWPALAVLVSIVELLVSTLVMTMAFYGLLRWLPDRPPNRRSLWLSAVVSAVLFAIGKELIGLYLGRASVSSSYGAAGSFIVVLLWVYYSAQLLLYGASVGYADEELRVGRLNPPRQGTRAAPKRHDTRRSTSPQA